MVVFQGDIVIKKNERLPYCPPELVSMHDNAYYKVDRCQDVFQFGIVLFFCLFGKVPWQVVIYSTKSLKYFYYQTLLVIKIQLQHFTISYLCIQRADTTADPNFAEFCDWLEHHKWRRSTVTGAVAGMAAGAGMVGAKVSNTINAWTLGPEC